MLEDDELYETFSHCRDLGALAMVHAENGHLIALVGSYSCRKKLKQKERETLYFDFDFIQCRAYIYMNLDVSSVTHIIVHTSIWSDIYKVISLLHA